MTYLFFFKVEATGEILRLDTPISGEQQVDIYDRIRVIPELLIFPWIPGVESGNDYKYQFTVSLKD